MSSSLNGISLKTGFHQSAKPQAQQSRRKSYAPISIRFTPEERAQLERDAAGQALSAYVRACALRKVSARKTYKTPIKDYRVLANIIGYFSKSNTFSDIKALLQASEAQTLYLEPEVKTALLAACNDISVMRHDLVAALGVKPE
jgi:glyoxylate carboligase